MSTIGIPSFWVINRFLEDTCVITALAYLISRGVLMPRLFETKQKIGDQMLLAVIFGLAGGSDLVFPGDRYPYVTFTLMASFAGYAGGLRLGALTVFFMVLLVLGSVATGAIHLSLILYISSIAAACVIGVFFAALRRKIDAIRHNNLFGNFVWGACLSSAAAEASHRVLLHLFVTNFQTSWLLIFYSVCSNAFAGFLLGIILWDAHARHEANERQIRTERELANMRLSQLVELQARLHPHFLFNALAGLAGLCVIDASRAERGITDLANLLRRFMRAPSDVSVPLYDELKTIDTYLTIEKMRLGDRLEVLMNVPDDLRNLLVPRFALQVPVENAVQHGVAVGEKPGKVAIFARRRKSYLILAVWDTGSPYFDADFQLSDEAHGESERPHGLQLLAARLKLVHGNDARIKLLRTRNRGSVCVLRIPVSEGLNRL